MKGPEPDEGIWNNIFISEILSKFTSQPFGIKVIILKHLLFTGHALSPGKFC